MYVHVCVHTCMCEKSYSLPPNMHSCTYIQCTIPLHIQAQFVYSILYPTLSIHAILETDSLEETIYGSSQSSDRSTKQNVSRNTDHKSGLPQNCKQDLKKSNDQPPPLSLHKVLTADPGIYKEEHLVRKCGLHP